MLAERVCSLQVKERSDSSEVGHSRGALRCRHDYVDDHISALYLYDPKLRNLTRRSLDMLRLLVVEGVHSLQVKENARQLRVGSSFLFRFQFYSRQLRVGSSFLFRFQFYSPFVCLWERGGEQ
jgi:hypothetical protein